MRLPFEDAGRGSPYAMPPWGESGARAIWTPAALSGVIYWWGGDYGVTLIGGVVSAWEDRIAGASLVQGVANKRPAMTTLGGQPALLFDADDFLAKEIGADKSQPFTILGVVKTPSNLSTSHYACLTGYTSTSYAIRIRDNGRIYGRYGATRHTPNSSIALNTTYRLRAYFSGASSKVYVGDSEKSYDGSPGTNAFSRYMGIGNTHFENMTYWGGDALSTGVVADYILCSGGLTAEEVTLFNTWADERYSL